MLRVSPPDLPGKVKTYLTNKQAEIAAEPDFAR